MNRLIQTISTWAVAILLLLPFTASADTILTVGDSITSGLKRNSTGSYWYCPPDDVTTSSFYVCDGDDAKNRGGYQPSTRSKLSNVGISANLYNWGFAGEESGQILGRTTQAMNARSADAVFIMAGINDLNDGISDASIAFNIERMIDAVCDRGLIPVLGLITPRFDGPSSWNSRIQNINSMTSEYAESLNVPVADNYGALISNWNAYQSGDDLHIGNAGDSRMATEWVAAYQQSGSACKVGVDISGPTMILLLDD